MAAPNIVNVSTINGKSAVADLGTTLTTTLLTAAADGSSGQILQTDGSGTLSFTTPSSGISTGKAIAMALVFG